MFAVIQLLRRLKRLVQDSRVTVDGPFLQESLYASVYSRQRHTMDLWKRFVGLFRRSQGMAVPASRCDPGCYSLPTTTFTPPTSCLDYWTPIGTYGTISPSIEFTQNATSVRLRGGRCIVNVNAGNHIMPVPVLVGGRRPLLALGMVV